MPGTTQHIQEQLERRRTDSALRTLSYSAGIDFSSNDYLGFARSEVLHHAIPQGSNHPTHGSSGSRLLTGNTSFIEETEQYIADFHDSPAGLIYNSGYDANVGLLSCIARRGDTIITDDLIHASLIDGCRLSYADRKRFRHNDVDDLEKLLKTANGEKFIVVESIYSMDGDIAPLKDIANLCERYQANLIVDEAHATGVRGINGVGIVQELGLQDKVFARVVTFGKALGCHGAIVLGSKVLREYLINFSRSFIYTTAAPLHNIAAVRAAYELLPHTDAIAMLTENIRHFHESTNMPFSLSPIKTVLFNSNIATRNAAISLQKKGFDIRPILSPTVPQGTERLRICLHAFNTKAEIRALTGMLNQIQNG